MHGATTANTATTATTPTLTTEQLLASMKAAMAVLPPDPLAQEMAADGFDPKAGGILIMPDAYRALDWGPFGPPNYVRFSPIVRVPTYGLDFAITQLKANHDL